LQPEIRIDRNFDFGGLVSSMFVVCFGRAAAIETVRRRHDCDGDAAVVLTIGGQGRSRSLAGSTPSTPLQQEKPH